MNKSIVTEFDSICFLCSNRSQHTHHLVYGNANRRISDKEGLVIPLCESCHRMIHSNSRVGMMSKIIGQLAWELNYVAEREERTDARETFRKKIR